MDAELTGYLKRFARRLRWRDTLAALQYGLPAAALAGLLFQIAGRLWPLPDPLRWSLAAAGACLLAAVGYGLLRPLPLRRAAWRVDVELGLKERLSTALALAAPAASRTAATRPRFPDDLVERQGLDALETARRIEPRRDLSFRFYRRPVFLAGLLMAAALALVILPNPMEAELARRAAIREAAARQAEEIEDVREEIEEAENLSPEERDELLRQLAELAEQLRANPGDLEEALANLSRLEEALREQADPNAASQRAMLEALAAQLSELAQQERSETASDAEAAAEALEQLAERMQELPEGERQELARALAQMAARAGQTGDSSLAAALAALSQAAQSGDAQAAAEASAEAADALAQAEMALADQAALQRALAQLQNSRQSLADTGRAVAALNPGDQPGQGPGQQNSGQNPGAGQNGGQGNNPGQGSSGQGQAGSGGGSQADQLPPSRRTGRAGSPEGPDRSMLEGELDAQVYVPRERLDGEGELFIPGQDTGQGETQVRERPDPLPGAVSPSLVPYQEVFGAYAEAASQALDQSYVPPGLKDYVRDYFSLLEP